MYCPVPFRSTSLSLWSHREHLWLFVVILGEIVPTIPIGRHKYTHTHTHNTIYIWYTHIGIPKSEFDYHFRGLLRRVPKSCKWVQPLVCQVLMGSGGSCTTTCRDWEKMMSQAEEKLPTLAPEVEIELQPKVGVRRALAGNFNFLMFPLYANLPSPR